MAHSKRGLRRPSPNIRPNIGLMFVSFWIRQALGSDSVDEAEQLLPFQSEIVL